ncbi:MAG: DUF692 family protein [Candidatus Omnitrophica bacterium]|nr:DUF692 family protein [Candidatus Omnitrophota bacterium]
MSFPLLGCGIGLRAPHYAEILGPARKLDWFEAISENYMDTGGRPLQILEKIRKNYPVGLHGVALSVGSTDPIHLPYLEKLKTLIDRIDPAIVSDHICWSGVAGEHLHDLLPLPFTEESIRLIVEKTDQIQNFLGRQILLENVSTYVTFKHSEMQEWDFVREIARRSGCGLLLDINNVYVNARNHGFDAQEYLRNIPGEFVGQIHLAGHTDKGKFLFDTHSSPVIDEVWELYRQALELWGSKTTLIEWDEDIPELERLIDECDKARKIYQSVRVERHCEESLRDDAGISVRKGGIASLAARNDIKVETSLKNIQLWMQSQIRDGSSQLLEAQQVTEEPSLNPQAGDPGVERLDVYREGYLARTEESLKEVYEAVRHVLGDGVFHDLAHQYAQSFSSPDFNLNLKGRSLPDFLKQTSWTEKLPFLPDLACLEWKIAEAFHGFDKPAFDPSFLFQLNSEDWKNLRILFQPSVSLLESSWPILDLWQSRKTPVEEIRMDLVNRPQKVLVARRPSKEVFCRLLTEREFRVLILLKQGKSLGEMFEFFDEEEADLPLTDWFSAWTREGLIASS